MILGEKSLRIFGTNVAVCRKNKGMTQEELAVKVGVSQTMINYIESGKKNKGLYCYIRKCSFSPRKCHKGK